MKKLTVLAVIALTLTFTSMLFAANLWQDNFDDNKLNAAYKTPSGGNGAGDPKWVEEGGAVKQTQPKPGDPTYLAIDVGKNINICGQIVRIRFDQWEDHDRSRAGVGFWLDPADKYQGYTTLIHNTLTVGNYQFLNDARGWHATKFDFNIGGVGKWFWMKAEINFTTKKLVGKVWLGDLKDEPKSWMIDTDYTTYGAVRNPTTWVGLNGGAGTTTGSNTVSFDNWYVYDALGPVSVDLQSKLTTTWGDLKR